VWGGSTLTCEGIGDVEPLAGLFRNSGSLGCSGRGELAEDPRRCLSNGLPFRVLSSAVRSSGDVRILSMIGSECVWRWFDFPPAGCSCCAVGEIVVFLLKVPLRVNEDRRSRIVGLVEGGLLFPEVAMRGWLSNLELEGPREELESLTCTALTSFVDVLGEELMLSPRTFDSSAADDVGGTRTGSSGSPERLLGGAGAPRSASCGAGGVFGAENQPSTCFIESERRSTWRKSERYKKKEKERPLEARATTPLRRT